MILHTILLYSQISDLLSHHQRSFLLKQRGRQRDLYQDITQRMRTLETLNLKQDASINPSLYRTLQESKKSKKGWRTLNKQGLQKQKDQVHTKTRRLREHAQSIYWPEPDGVLELKEVDTCTVSNLETISTDAHI